MPNDRRRGIPEPRLAPESKPVRFSFKHIEVESEKFNYSKCSGEFYRRLFLCLRTFSTWSVELFTDQNNNEHRHVIWFPETSELDGFANVPNIDPDQLGFHEAWQFSVCPDDPGNQWRVHGILIDDTFFIVWLDPDHQLYPIQLGAAKG
jgi:hypothetical protein